MSPESVLRLMSADRMSIEGPLPPDDIVYGAIS
jgi:hypothetical protein